ncbi:unnamed protein product [Linum trigynum]|uniref:CCHC-type domain-containing protein n=1 Tax=Linum trigynum TaxID=586398 RepID=A0AAV2CZS5_9ROSI
MAEKASSPPQPALKPQSFSYAKAVTGAGHLTSSKTQQWTPVGEHDLVPGFYNGEPALNLSPGFKEKLCAPWQKTLVVRLLGLRINYTTLCSRLRMLWRPIGSMEIMDLDDACYLVQLSNDQDYFKALTDGPWVIFDHYLAVQQWTPSFGVLDPLPKTIIVWIQLPRLKVHFYHKEILTSLGNLVGRTIKLDYHTLNRQRRKFDRLAVEVDLSKPLVPRIFLDGKWQMVEYENLPVVCFECGKIGHNATSCPMLCPVNTPSQLVITGGETPATPPTVADESNPGFGPWMLVTKKSRRNPRGALKKGKSESDFGAAVHGQYIKEGKDVAKVKESGVHISQVVTQRIPTHQRPNVQERKGEQSGKEGGGSLMARKDSHKGKGIIKEDNGHGILGPKPLHGNSKTNGPRPNIDYSRASTSAAVQGENGASLKASTKPASPKRGMPASPVVHTSQGPNGTNMQIISVQAPPKILQQPDPSQPTAGARTKSKKSDRLQVKKGTPVKDHPSKALQVWSPIKDRKSKSRAQMATLTLQEIHAWTNAAGENALAVHTKTVEMNTKEQHATTLAIAEGGSSPPVQ